MKIITFLFILMSISCFSQIEENLLVHYKFDGSTLDETENGFDGTANNITYTADRFGNENSAAYFNGVNSFIDLPNLVELKPQLPVTFAFWIEYDSSDYQDRAVFNTSFEDDVSSGIYFNTQIATGNYAVNFGDGSPFYNPTSRRSYTSNHTIENHKWVHVTVIVKTALDMDIYIDCKEDGGTYSGEGDDIFYSLTPGSIGRNDRNLNVPAHYFKGSIDDFRYWDRALSEDEVVHNLCSVLHTSEFLESKFLVYPNPAQNILNVQSNSKTDFHLNIFNNVGKLVLSTYSTNEINIGNLSNGLYFLQFTSEKNTQTKKLIINR
ncbi:LamG-like jellyroll fold domain-containing protein [Aequorivita viscosa]|uniref:Por secretion system C-terminal sorting domain-containing protein n=1 Tax=Aequorivita viscosa TaxID=797419 RepID=A0A1M6DUV9_9FLAO|nr:LamG-like jellyroll fold domain-containing protein [Aequorivita viscosa]SDW48913.1 Por secretion system C-terminal sorting domain-containing protein [Aequorivita viscosa]SHI77036.1 Por secretion system C-terminal sorting domain-containing protein [Aequorivita viscosa]